MWLIKATGRESHSCLKQIFPDARSLDFYTKLQSQQEGNEVAISIDYHTPTDVVHFSAVVGLNTSHRDEEGFFYLNFHYELSRVASIFNVHVPTAAISFINNKH